MRTVTTKYGEVNLDSIMVVTSIQIREREIPPVNPDNPEDTGTPAIFGFTLNLVSGTFLDFSGTEEEMIEERRCFVMLLNDE